MTEPVKFMARISRIDVMAAGVKAFTIERDDGQPWPEWMPGAHVDIALEGGLGRQYSLCGDPADRMRLDFAVLREPASRGGSAFLHDQAAVGSAIAVVDVRNNFPLVDAARYRFVAGGIGITPLLPMIRELERQGKDWALLYGGRTRASMAYLDVLRQYTDKVTVCPQDEFGLLDLPAFLGNPAPGTVAYCCGPEPLIQAVERHCASWPEELLHIERFRPRELEALVQAAPFEVELRRSGLTVTVPPEKSIADVLDEAGFHIPRSCNEGTCGTCLTKVLEGTPDHRDSFLRPKQRALNNKILVCCSRASSPRLVLDV